MLVLLEGVPPAPKKFVPAKPRWEADTCATELNTRKTIPVTCGTEKRLVYLAAPYTHPCKMTQQMRFHAINMVAAYLMNELGLFIFSPISHSHPIAEDGEIPTTWEFWKPYDEEILRCCGRMIVLTLPGWKESKGVQAEIEIATKLGIDISYLDPRGLA